MLFEGEKIPVVVEQFVTIDDATGGDQGIDGLSNGNAFGPKRDVVSRSLHGYVAAADHNKIGKPEQFCDLLKGLWVAAALQDFG